MHGELDRPRPELPVISKGTEREAHDLMVKWFSQTSTTATLALVCLVGFILGACGDDPVDTPNSSPDLNFLDAGDASDVPDQLDQADEDMGDTLDTANDRSSDASDQSDGESDTQEDAGDDSVEPDEGQDLIDAEDSRTDSDALDETDEDTITDVGDSVDDVDSDVADDTFVPDVPDTFIPPGDVLLGFGELVEEFRTSTLEITIQNPSSVGAFQFTVAGLEFDDHTPVSGGRAEDEGFRFDVNYDTGQITGYQGADPAILNPEPLGVLLVIKFKNFDEDNAVDEVCLEDVQINDKEGEIVESDVGPCFCFVDECE